MKINRKLLLVILISFGIMIIGVIIGANYYFNNYYEIAKIDNLAENINDFSEGYIVNDYTQEELYRQIYLFNTNNNANLSISTENKSERNEENHEEGNNKILVTTKLKDQYYDFFISNETFEKLDLNIGDTIFIEGNLENGIVNISIINEYEVRNDIEKKFSESVTIVDVKKDLYVSNEASEKNELLIEDQNSYQGIDYTVSIIPNTDIKTVNLTKEVDENTIIYVNASLQSISETKRILMSFLPYIIIMALLISIILYYFFSRIITKPIIRITNGADKIAQMKFDEDITVTSSDEIGMLSKSINTMSLNLQLNINELERHNKKLIEDFEREKEIEKSRKEFIANASHELKTPLSIIKNYIEGITDETYEDINEYIDVINQEIASMDKLIMDMLILSKQDSFSEKLNISKFKILEAVTKIASNFQEKALHNKINILILGNEKNIYADKDKINRILINLISNAVKYADENSQIEVTINSFDDKVRVEIYNMCKAFSEIQMVRVWDRFYKIDISHSSEIEGTGLGLSIVKNIFEQHSLDYGVYNRDDGIVFWFEIKNQLTRIRRGGFNETSSY